MSLTRNQREHQSLKIERSLDVVDDAPYNFRQSVVYTNKFNEEQQIDNNINDSTPSKHGMKRYLSIKSNKSQISNDTVKVEDKYNQRPLVFVLYSY